MWTSSLAGGRVGARRRGPLSPLLLAPTHCPYLQLFMLPVRTADPKVLGLVDPVGVGYTFTREPNVILGPVPLPPQLGSVLDRLNIKPLTTICPVAGLVNVKAYCPNADPNDEGAGKAFPTTFRYDNEEREATEATPNELGLAAVPVSTTAHSLGPGGMGAGQEMLKGLGAATLLWSPKW